MALRRPLSPMHRFRRDRSGVAAVEFAMVATPFFPLIFAALEAAIYMGGGVVLDNAVQNAARKVPTGQVQTADIMPDAFRKSICDQVSFMLTCGKLAIDMCTYATFSRIDVEISSKLGQLDDTGFCFNPGAQGEITVIRAFYPRSWVVTTRLAGHLLGTGDTDTGGSLLFSMAAFMNEPFGTAASTKATCA